MPPAACSRPLVSLRKTPSSPLPMTDHKPSRRPAPDIQQLIGNTLRIGVTLACAIALVGGLLYLLQHGGEPAKDYSHFPCTASDAERTAYTTLGGIWHSLCAMTAVGWIQTGVIVLLLTPIMRVALSLVDFVRERDWLYAAISAVVLTVIILNSIEGF